MTEPRTSARDTRAEILDVATQLFAEKGYDATSLREIAERLGITKAALYYHFRSKDDILRALLEPMNTVVTELLERLEAAPDVAGWVDALDWVIGMVFQNVAFFRLIERNRHVMEELRETLLGDHVELHERVQAAVHAAATDVAQEIRMFAALGAVTAFDDWAPRLLADGPHDVIASELRAVVRAILGA